jgi:hypothetical protein
MRTLSAREKAILNLLEFIGIDYAVLNITTTGLKKGYTDATVPFREFLRRSGIHDYGLQTPGEAHIKYANVFGLTKKGTEVLKLSFQRPATKGGRMCRVSMIGGLKGPIHVQNGDLLIFAVRDNQLHVANLSEIADRTESHGSNSHPVKPEKGAAILGIAKNRIIHVMEAMPECEANAGMGARLGEIAELSGMVLEKKGRVLVGVLLDELCFEGRVQPVPHGTNKYRLCL